MGTNGIPEHECHAISVVGCQQLRTRPRPLRWSVFRSIAEKGAASTADLFEPCFVPLFVRFGYGGPHFLDRKTDLIRETGDSQSPALSFWSHCPKTPPQSSSRLWPSHQPLYRHFPVVHVPRCLVRQALVRTLPIEEIQVGIQPLVVSAR